MGECVTKVFLKRIIINWKPEQQFPFAVDVTNRAFHFKLHFNRIPHYEGHAIVNSNIFHIELIKFEGDDEMTLPSILEYAFGLPCGSPLEEHKVRLFRANDISKKHKINRFLMTNMTKFRVDIRLLSKRHVKQEPQLSLKPALQIAKCTFSSDIGKFLLSDAYSDIVITVNDQTIPAHRMILSRSPVFAALMENNEENKIVINDLEYEIVLEVLSYLYCGEAPNLKEHALKILTAADTYQLDRLKTQCEEVLVNDLNLENACEIFMKATLYNANQLREVAKEYITDNFIQMKGTAEFQELAETHLHLLIEILKCYGGTQKSSSDTSIRIITLPDMEV